MNIERLLCEKRDDIYSIAAKHGAYNIRIFGSAVRGEAGPDSDIDFLIDVGQPRALGFLRVLSWTLKKLVV